MNIPSTKNAEKIVITFKTNKMKLGTYGITIAYLYDQHGNGIGECLDTPNNVAYAFAINKKVHSARGILGEYEKKDIKSRKQTALDNAKYHSKYVKFY